MKKSQINMSIIAVVNVVSILVMVGWFLDISILKSIFPQWVTMKFTTALCFFISGLILYLKQLANEGKNEYASLFLPILSFVILIFASTILIGFFLNIRTGIESIFIEEVELKLHTIQPGQPSIITMIAFILIAILGLVPIIFLKLQSIITKSTGAIIVFIGFSAALGYLLNMPLLYFFIEGISSAMAIHTALLFILIGFGFILNSPKVPS